MKKFLAIYLGAASSRDRWMALSEAERKQREKAGMEAWHGWMTTNKAALVDPGGPLGKTKRASEKGIADIRNDMSGYCIFHADSHDAAVKLFEKHPHFSIFPGDAVEVMEILPIPGQ